MRVHKILSIIVLCCLVSIALASTGGLITVNAEGDSPQLEDAIEFEKTINSSSILEKEQTKETVDAIQDETRSDRSFTPSTGLLDIAVSEDDESDSDVAYGISEYGVVYEMESEIYIKFFTRNGNPLSSYQLSNGLEHSSNPAVAFEASNEKFVVAWQYDFMGSGDFDVQSRAVSATTGPVGNAIAVSATPDLETDPDLDCNLNDASCLIVFTFEDDSTTYIKGRYMDISASGVSAPSHDPFRVSDLNDMVWPHVTWGWASDAYMVVFQRLSTDTSDAYPVYNHLYGSYQSTGEQYKWDPDVYLINPGELPYDVFETAITYDPITECFLTLVSHDYNGDGSDFDIRMVVADGASMFGYEPHDGYSIAYTTDVETRGQISFLTNAWPGFDQVAIAYRTTPSDGLSYGIMTTVITGNGSTSDPVYDIPDESEHILVLGYDAFEAELMSPAISGSYGSPSNYMVTFTEFLYGSGNDDIKGMILQDSCYMLFLPFVIK